MGLPYPASLTDFEENTWIVPRIRSRLTHTPTSIPVSLFSDSVILRPMLYSLRPESGDTYLQDMRHKRGACA
jgi:hypothetical protein